MIRSSTVLGPSFQALHHLSNQHAHLPVPDVILSLYASLLSILSLGHSIIITMESTYQIRLSREQVTQFHLKHIFYKYYGPLAFTTQYTLPWPTRPQFIKKKRNDKTRLQYKKRRTLEVTVQGQSEQSVEDSVEHSEPLSSIKAIKHVVSESTRSWIKRAPWWLAVVCRHAVTQWSEMSPVGSTAIATGAAEMSRHGIG